MCVCRFIQKRNLDERNKRGEKNLSVQMRCIRKKFKIRWAKSAKKYYNMYSSIEKNLSFRKG